MDTTLDEIFSNYWKIECTDVDSIQQLIEVCEQLAKVGWCFRGQLDAKWDLSTSLDRYEDCVSKQNFEKKCLALANDLFPHIEEYRAIERLGLLQHYGAKTRLLDISTSPDVALWFAFEEISSSSPNPCALYAIRTEWLEHTVDDSIEEFSQKFPDTVRSWPTDKFQRREQFVAHHMKSDSPIALCFPVTPASLSSNQRIRNQAGKFLLCSNINVNAEENIKGTHNVIKKHLKEEANKSPTAYSLSSALKTNPSLNDLRDDIVLYQKISSIIKFTIPANLHDNAVSFLEKRKINKDYIYPQSETEDSLKKNVREIPLSIENLTAIFKPHWGNFKKYILVIIIAISPQYTPNFLSKSAST